MPPIEITCRNCGKNFSVTPSKKNKIKYCSETCRDEKLKKKLEKEAIAVGLTIIGEGKNTQYRTYRFNDCGHEHEITVGGVRNNTFQCRKCYETKLQEEAQAVGLTLIGKGRSIGDWAYRFNDCGHEQLILRTVVQNNYPYCHTCQQIKLEKEAQAVGLTIIGKGRNKNFLTYRFNDCGHEKEITMTNVRKHAFLCNTCEETTLDLPSKVYLLKIQSGSFIWLKLGYAKNIKDRIRRYYLPKNTKAKRLKYIDFDTGWEARAFEESIHSKYLRKRLPSKKMKEYLTDGYSECYPLEMLDTLIGELESL